MGAEKLRGRVRKGQTAWVSTNWQRNLRAHREEAPDLREFVPGSFNIDLTDPPIWRPPNEGFFYTRSRERGLWLGRTPGTGERDDVIHRVAINMHSNYAERVVGGKLFLSERGRGANHQRDQCFPHAPD